MSRARSHAGGHRDDGQARELPTLHPWRQTHPHAARYRHDRPKQDRLVVGILSGALLFYLIGKALGLGQPR